MNLSDFSGILQTGIALNLGISAFQFFGDLSCTGLKRRLKSAEGCEFLFLHDATKLIEFKGLVGKGRTRFRQLEAAIGWYTERFIVPLLLACGVLCCALLAISAWNAHEEVGISAAWFYLGISFAPSIMALITSVVAGGEQRDLVREVVQELENLISR